jgi:hypothetical protein
MLVKRSTRAFSDILLPIRSLNGPANNLTMAANRWGNPTSRPIKAEFLEGDDPFTAFMLLKKVGPNWTKI